MAIFAAFLSPPVVFCFFVKAGSSCRFFVIACYISAYVTADWVVAAS